jgi:hypothetical protein
MTPRGAGRTRGAGLRLLSPLSTAFPSLVVALAQIDRGPMRGIRSFVQWIDRNPVDGAFYISLILLFSWAIWRFGKG